MDHVGGLRFEEVLWEETVRLVGESRRYEPTPNGLRMISGLMVLRERVLGWPSDAGRNQIAEKPEHQSPGTLVPAKKDECFSSRNGVPPIWRAFSLESGPIGTSTMGASIPNRSQNIVLSTSRGYAARKSRLRFEVGERCGCCKIFQSID
jgi:hypothetical protein